MTDLEPFAAFMRNYQDMVFSTAVRLLGNAADAEDIAQEVFLRAYDRFPAFEGVQHVGGWLRKVARNLSLNHLNRYRVRWRFFSELKSEENDDDFAASLPAPDTSAADLGEADRRALLESALQKLPPAQRLPLVLFHFEEMSYEEIAAHTGVSLSKVKTDIHRGREALRRKLQTRLGRELAPERAAARTPAAARPATMN